MIDFIRAHGYDPGPTQRPLLAGVLAAALACIPTAVVFLAFGSFPVAADLVLRAPRWIAAAVIVAAFMVGGLLYGAFFRRAANDVGAGWMLGLAYGFVLWAVAPATVLPLLGGDAMAAGHPAVGFFTGFLVWGLALGLAFPYVHRPLQSGLDGARLRFGPDYAGLKRRLLHRPF